MAREMACGGERRDGSRPCRRGGIAASGCRRVAVSGRRRRRRDQHGAAASSAVGPSRRRSATAPRSGPIAGPASRLRRKCADADAPMQLQVRSRSAGGTPLRVLLIVGHPRAGSFSHALAARLCAGRGARRRRAARAGAGRLSSTRRTTRRFADQPVEPDIARARALLAWAEHLVLVYPTWWGTMPACSRASSTASWRRASPSPRGGASRRCWRPLRRAPDHDGHAGLGLALDLRRAGDKAIARATLGFCGIEVVRIARFGPIKDPPRRSGRAGSRPPSAAARRCAAAPSRRRSGSAASSRAGSRRCACSSTR